MTCLSAEAGVLDFRIQHIVFENSTMKDALTLLREYGIQVGLERAPSHAGEARFSQQLRNVRVKDILDYLTQADPRYAYETVGCNLIHVYPKNAKEDPDNLLNVKIKEFEVHQYDLYKAIYHIAHLAPELRDLLQRKMRSGSVPGSSISGDMDPVRPKISLKLKNVTVRDILNEIAGQSNKVSSGNRDFPPVGWLYEFRVDETSALGGYPSWQVF